MADHISYKILILMPIPVFEENGAFYSMDLWARDINTQATLTTVDLVCPVLGKPTEGPVAKLDPKIKVHSDICTDAELARIVARVDVVQLGTSGWLRSRLTRRLLKIAKKTKTTVITGISSDRAKSEWLNASNKVKGALRYLDVWTCRSWIAFRSDGVFVVGHGLSKLFSRLNSNVHTGIASWIQESDIAPMRNEGMSQILNLCMASRMEKMKGMHVGVAAVNLVRRHQLDLRLLIIGDGPEEEKISQQIFEAGLISFTTFKSTVSYPQPFLNILRSIDIVLLTNLSTEQPRLIFDALSQGCLPLCPDIAAYRDLGLDDRLFYRQGEAVDLCRAIEDLYNPTVRKNLHVVLSNATRKFTIEAMHEERAKWVVTLLRHRVAHSGYQA